MKRLIAACGILALTAALSFAQDPLSTVYDVTYNPATASDTNLDVSNYGRPMFANGAEILRWDVALLDTLALNGPDDDSNGITYVQFTLWGGTGYNAEMTAYDDIYKGASGGNLGTAYQWDSLVAFAADSTEVASWPKHAVLIAADSIWHYDRYRIKARWDYHFDNTAHWDTDSTFSNTPIFHHRIVTRYD